MLNERITINCKGRLLLLANPIIMGILNVTPDSFYDGGKFGNLDETLRQVEKMLKEGATIIDVGGMSSKPGAEIISVDTEKQRVLPVLERATREFPEAIFSVDTIRGVVAEQAIAAGAHIINDISAGKLDDAMYDTVARLGVPYILMHMRGTPKNMQQQIQYDDVVQEILGFLTTEVGHLRDLGVVDLIVDVGFGFGKTVNQNYQLLQSIPVFKVLDCPILVGLSRKSMICKVLNVKPAAALNGTSVLHLAALQNGAKILRVHDVREAMEVIKLWEMLEANSLSVEENV